MYRIASVKIAVGRHEEEVHIKEKRIKNIDSKHGVILDEKMARLQHEPGLCCIALALIPHQLSVLGFSKRAFDRPSGWCTHSHGIAHVMRIGGLWMRFQRFPVVCLVIAV